MVLRMKKGFHINQKGDGMKPEEILFCRLIRLALHPGESLFFTEEDLAVIAREADSIFSIAKRHSMQIALYDSFCALQVPLSPSLNAAMEKMVLSGSLQSYQMLLFTRRILSILSEEGVRYILLKGASLLPFYPKLEFRGYGDVDILIPDAKEFKRVRKRFLDEGFSEKKDYADHQLELFYTEGGRRYLLELHSKVIGSQDDRNLNKKTVELFSGLTGNSGSFPEADLKYSTFPETENTLYLLLHMLQHFLYSGFGIKLLCDWTTFIEANSGKIDWERYQNLVSDFGLAGFSNAMAGLCIKYLGLPEDKILLPERDRPSSDALGELMEDIMNAGEFGKTDTSRMLIMAKGKAPYHYLLQFHRQMKNRFPNAHKIVLIWPVLWVATGVCFLWNNHVLRGTSTREVLKTTRRRQHLLQELKLFQTEKKK